MVIAVVGTTATVVTTRSLQQLEESRSRHRFEQMSLQVAEEIRTRLRSYITLLSGGAGLFSGSREVSELEFERYTARLRLREDHSGVQGMGFVRMLGNPRAASTHLAEMRDRLGHDFDFSPPSRDSEERCVVDFIEPSDRRNLATLGWDMWSDPVRRGALQAARDSGQPASTPLLTLRQEIDDDRQGGFLIFVPVYGGGGVPPTVEERRRAVTGYTYCPFRIKDLITQVLPPRMLDGLTLVIHDQEAVDGGPLFRSHPQGIGLEPGLSQSTDVPVADRTWTLSTAAIDGFRHRSNGIMPWVTGVLGMLLTASVAGMTFVQARSRRHQDRAARSIAASEARYRLLATATASIVWSSDAESRFVRPQDSWESYTGQSWETHKDRGWLEAVHAGDRERLEETWSAARKARSKFEFEGRLWSHAARAHRWFVMRGVPMLRRDGTVHEWVGLVRDIQERRNLEESLLQSRKLESLGRLAGGVAHDFNNLLTAIIGSADLIDMEPGLSASSREYLNTIREAAKRSSVLTHHLLAFARKQVIEPRNVEINELVQALVPILTRLLGEDIKLVTSLPADTGLTRIDPGQFEQVLINLATNARDAMPQGGILSIQTSNAELDEEYTRAHEGVVPGRYIMLLVSDTGVGMDAAIQQHIFEPFFTTKESGKGTGLGLATCYGIVRQAGGFIWVYSEPGKGSLFRIFLPRADGTADRAGPAKEETPGFGTETILLVEDEPMVRQIATAALRGFGYSVLIAGSGEEALAIANAYAGEIHMVVTDVVLPGMSGRDLSERLRAVRPGLYALFCSGYTDSIISQRGVLEDGIAFLQKPYTPKQLARRVRGILDKIPETIGK